MAKTLRQGDGDGLCGIYSILNFLQQTEWADDPKVGLQFLLYSVEEFGWLTPHYLTEGFEEHHLKAILDQQIDRYRLSYKTYYVLDTMRVNNKLRSFSALAEAVESSGGAIIASPAGRAHWVLLGALSKKMKVWDSAAPAASNPKPIGKSRFSTEDGIVIVPNELDYADGWELST